MGKTKGSASTRIYTEQGRKNHDAIFCKDEKIETNKALYLRNYFKDLVIVHEKSPHKV